MDAPLRSHPVGAQFLPGSCLAALVPTPWGHQQPLAQTPTPSPELLGTKGLLVNLGGGKAEAEKEARGQRESEEGRKGAHLLTHPPLGSSPV